MSANSDRVVYGFMHLTEAERNEAVTKLNEYLNASGSEKSVLRENLQRIVKVDLGPIGQGNCPCCGR
jgi:hypothetical protein